MGLLACVGCERTRPEALSDADRLAIRSTADSTLAIINAPPPKDFAAYARSYYTEDAIDMPPSAPPLVGRAAIAAEESKDSSAYKYRWEQVEVAGYHDLAWVRGRYWSWGGRSKPDSGKYLEIWQRQPAGNWRVARDMYSSDVPRPPRAGN
jgi:ketosteroid isomerase-like protein